MASETASASSNYTVCLEAFARDFGDGNMVVAARRSDAVRYIVVACLTIALLDRILLLHRELKKIWSGPMSFPKFFYFLNRYPSLCCVGLDVFVFTQRVADRSDCVWWFTFRAWAAIFVSTCLEALLVFKLWQLFGKCNYIVYGFSGLSIAQTIGTSFLVRARTRSVKFAPIPGEWFSGCFPLFTHPHAVAHEWISLTAVISAMTFAALVWTINTWRKNRDDSLWEIAKEKSIFHIMGLCATTLFCAAFFLTAPQPLSSIVPSVSSTMFSVFGCRIAIEMPNYSNCDLLRNLPRGDYELDDIDESTKRRKKGGDDLESANGSLKTDRFSEVSNLDIIKPVGGAGSDGGLAAAAITAGALDISPLSQAAALVPMPTIEIRGGEESRALQPTGEFRASEVTLSSNEAAQPQPLEQAATKTPAASRRSTLVGGATLKSSSNERPPFQVVPILGSKADVPLEPEARDARSSIRTDGPMTTPAVKTSAQQEGEDEDDFDDLDRKLAEEYDEHGRRRPPRRTHRRHWKSEACSGLPPMLSGQGFLIPRASSPLAGGRPASAIYYSSPRPTVFPLEPAAGPSGSASPSTSSRRRSADRSVSPRSRMSLFFHRHHRNDVGSVAVPEGEVPSSFAVPPSPVAENPTVQSPIRRHSTSSSAKSSARGRMRRLLLSGTSSPSLPPPTSSAPLPPQLPSSPSTPSPIAFARQSSARWRDSDAMTIRSVSTGFAFDNTGTYEAPDFN